MYNPDCSASHYRRGNYLILGSTYPNYSRKHREQVCTGALDLETNRLVRFYPMPRRYLEEANRFRPFQIVTLSARPNPSDSRPGSLLIDPRSIEPGEVIHDPGRRRRLMEQCAEILPSMASVKERWRISRASLAIVRPREVTRVRITPKSNRERAEWMAREAEILAQQSLLGDDASVKPLDFPDVNFEISFICGHPSCLNIHTMHLLDWGIHELWRKLRGDAAREPKVVAAMARQLDTRARDVWLYLGNFAGTEVNFGLMGSTSFERTHQLELAL